VEEQIWRPTPKQAEFLSCSDDEVLYGGAAGGGKTDALLFDAVGQVGRPTYRALILRQTFPQLREMLDRARRWYPILNHKVEFYDRPWTEWRWPNGAKVIFASCDRDIDVHQFQGQEYQWIGVDELGHYSSPYVWDYLTSRNRSADPLMRCYMRATCNPGPKWIQERWGINDNGGAASATSTVTLQDGRQVEKRMRFIPAHLRDNPHLGDGQYEANLQRLPDAERAALLEGRWGVVDVPGAVYRDELKQARLEGRVTSVPYDKAALVNTHWDIGIRDATTIWCTQQIGHEWHLIDYYEANNRSAADHAGWLKSTGYAFGEHYLPHDAEAREKGSGLTYQEILDNLKVVTKITPRLGKEEGINAARMVFNRCWFDAVKCEKGLRALQFYRREWKDRLGQYMAPVHDHYSNGADSFRYFAVNSNDSPGGLKLPPLKYPRLTV
jgi:hypothetical protein